MKYIFFIFAVAFLFPINSYAISKKNTETRGALQRVVNMERKEVRKATPIVAPVVTETQNVTGFILEADTIDVINTIVLVDSTLSTTTEFSIITPILLSIPGEKIGDISFPDLLSTSTFLGTTTSNLIIHEMPQNVIEFNVVPMEENYWDF